LTLKNIVYFEIIILKNVFNTEKGDKKVVPILSVFIGKIPVKLFPAIENQVCLLLRSGNSLKKKRTVLNV
jgi:hypothetical protein